MPCARFEDLLLDYAELSGELLQSTNAHLAECAEGQAFLQKLDQFDVSLTTAFSASRVSPGFEAAVLRRVSREAPIPKPSFLPEVLDFVGWAAVSVIVAGLIYQLVLLQAVASYALGALAIASVATAIWASLRSYAELKH